MRNTKARCQSIFTILFLYFISIISILFFRASHFTREFYRAHFTIWVNFNNTEKPSMTGDVTYIRANESWRTWDGWKVATSSRLLYLLLFFSWRLNGSRFLIEKHAVNARRGRFYARKTGPRLLARERAHAKFAWNLSCERGERFTVL